MLEIEIKAYCDDLDKAAEDVRELGGKEKYSRLEMDTYFSHPSRDFKETDEAFRIRSAGEKNILTYKGPKLGEKTKTRIEEEAEFSDAVALKGILIRLGFSVVDEVVKERTVYEIGGIEVCLDRVNDVGDFVELETGGVDREKGEAELFKLAERLGLSRFERRSYLELKLERF